MAFGKLLFVLILQGKVVLFPPTMCNSHQSPAGRTGRKPVSTRVSCDSCEQCPLPEKESPLTWVVAGWETVTGQAHVCVSGFVFFLKFPSTMATSPEVYCWARCDFRHCEMTKQEKKRGGLYGLGDLRWAEWVRKGQWVLLGQTEVRLQAQVYEIELSAPGWIVRESWFCFYGGKNDWDFGQGSGGKREAREVS